MTSTYTFEDGRSVHRLGFGAMRLTGWDHVKDGAAAVARRAAELGVTFFDTADAYDLGLNEELLADALHPYRGLFIATKCGHARPSRGEWVPLGRPEYLRQQAELSLRRLRADCLDLLQLHRVDPQVPLADQVGALARLRDEGKVARIGLSEVTVAQLAEARAIAPIASVQNRYHLTDRGSDDVLAYCERERIAFVPWLPIARGGHATAGGAGCSPRSRRTSARHPLRCPSPGCCAGRRSSSRFRERRRSRISKKTAPLRTSCFPTPISSG